MFMTRSSESPGCVFHLVHHRCSVQLDLSSRQFSNLSYSHAFSAATASRSSRSLSERRHTLSCLGCLLALTSAYCIPSWLLLDDVIHQRLPCRNGASPSTCAIVSVASLNEKRVDLHDRMQVHRLLWVSHAAVDKSMCFMRLLRLV
jgi:hypothetical protein